MEPMVGKICDAVRRLAGMRGMLGASAVALCGYGFGHALHAGMPVAVVDLLLFLAVIAIGAAAFAMTSAELRAARQQKRKLDALFGRNLE